MLTSIKLGNFKAFGPTQTIPIKPITLIFGPNSAGKSSIIHSLLLAHQASVVDGELDVHYPRLSGSTVDLGGFAGYVHRHQTGSAVNWGCEFSAINYADRWRNANSRLFKLPGVAPNWRAAARANGPPDKA